MSESSGEPSTFYRDKDLESRLEERLTRWLNGEATEPGERVFIIRGWPGIGKSWFLRHLEAREGGLWGRFERFYLDLEEWRNVPAEWQLTSRQREWIERIEQARKPVCLLVDHIPWARYSWLRFVENEVIVPAFERGAFLILASRTRRWGFAIVPHTTPYEMKPLEAEDVDRFLDSLPECEDHQAAREIGGGYPYLMKAICRVGRREGCRDFLRYWLSRFGWKAEHMEELLKEARRWLPQQGGEVRSKPLLQVGWVEFVEGEDGQLRKQWVPAVRRCLEELLSPNVPRF